VPVLAAQASDVDPFRPSASLATGQGSLQGESPYLLGEGISAGMFASFAQDLAVEDRGDRVDPLVRSVLPIEMYAGWTFADRVRVEAFLPVYAHVDAPVSGYDGTALGDLRLQANLPLWQSRDDIRFGIVPRIELPTGTANAFTRRGFQVGLSGALAGRHKSVGWVANAGLAVSEASEFEGVGTGSAVELLAGGWWQPGGPTGGYRLGAEVESQLGLVGGTTGSNSVGTGHVYGQTALPGGLAMTVGAGTGVLNGLGAPNYRMFAALTYGTTVEDRDGDGILDPVDACVEVPEDMDGFEDEDGCPEVDNDLDTIVDTRDTCPDDPEDFDGFEDDDGCPDLDNDFDTVVDTEDLCPMEPGLPELAGCPDTDGDGIADSGDACPVLPGKVEFDGCPDRDGDTIIDPEDACPDDPIDEGVDPATSDGCPTLAIVEGDTIKIGEKVRFATGSAELDPNSSTLLNAVAGLMKRKSEIRKVEIAGHTDNVGSDAFNLDLSKRRAASVRSYLLDAGVEADRLVSQGYGESRPTTTNRTRDGRATNRRVEFTILEQVTPVAPPPTPTPKPAPVPPAPGFEVEGSDLEDPWDAEPRPDPTPAPAPTFEPGEDDLLDPWDAVPTPGPASVKPAPAPAAEPVPAPVPKPAPAPTVESAPAPSPEPSGIDPDGEPGRISIELRGIDSAEVWLDNERLPLNAPLRRFPIIAGSHKLWVVNQEAGLDFQTTIVLGNGEAQVLILPPGASTPQTTPTDEPAPLVPRHPGADSRAGARAQQAQGAPQPQAVTRCLAWHR
jgi:outer membrane protein OmpA-like peptidoglycan-associated protein